MSEITMKKEELVELMATVAKDAAEAAVAKHIEDNGTSTKKFGSFKGSFADLSDTEQKALSAKQKGAHFIKAIYHKDANALAQFKAMSEGTNSAGGFVVPEEFAAEVNRVVEDFGLVAKLARKFPMKSDTLNVPRLSASVTITYPGENTAGTGSQPTFENVQLLSKTAVGLTPMSNELLADANVSVIDLLTELFAEALAGDLDTQGLAGAAAPFTGILTDAGVTVVQPANGGGFSTFTGCSTPDNLRDLISNVKPWSLQGAAYIMHRTVWAIVQKAKSSTGGDYFASAANPILSNTGVQNYPTAMAGTLWGYPVYLSDKMPTATAVSTKYVIFGNLKHVYVGQRDEMSVAISGDGVVGGVSLFESNMSAVRVTTRRAVAVGLPTAFAVLKTAAS